MQKTLFSRFPAVVSIVLLGMPFFSEVLIARAGGGGGSHGGGSHGGGSHGGGSHGGGFGHGAGGYSGGYSGHGAYYGNSGHSGGSPLLTIIVLVISIYVIYRLVVYFRNSSNSRRFNAAATVQPTAGTIAESREFPAAKSDFDLDGLLSKVRKAFIEVQTAWSEQNTDRMRRFITDGVYQRFNTQFRMMSLLRQSNPLTNIRIIDVRVDSIEHDGMYDIANVAIHASMNDKFECALNHELDEEGDYDFVEYWSFLRKRGAAGKNIYDSPKCPNCGAPLPENIGELCKCRYCNAMVNSGEFDWVLAEITQEDDYRREGRFTEKMAGLDEKVREMASTFGDFAVQLLEDKASNAYMQIMTAYATHDPSLMRRFVTDALFHQLAPQIEKHQEIFNRIFLNNVTLIGAEKIDNTNLLIFSLACSYQRAVITNNSVKLVDPEIVMREEVLMLNRDIGAGEGKGSIYQHNCPLCGGPVKDTLDIKCSFCGSPLNSTANDWIVCALMSRSDFMNRDFPN
jgi:predicted lipid-binding transport protein (Tim44 family)